MKGYKLLDEGFVNEYGHVYEFDKEYQIAAIWKDGKFQIYLDGKLLGEGDIPLAKVKFNDLFIGPFKDKYIHSFNKWSDSCLLSELKVWNLVPEMTEIFPEQNK